MHSQQVYAIARKLSSSDESALELTQNAFQQAWKELTAIPPKLSYRIFVCRFLIKEAVDRLGHPDLSVSAWLERFLPEFDACGRLSALPWDCAELEGLARRSEFADRIRQALAGLDPKDRAVFVLRCIEELPLDEVSAIMEMPASVVRERAHRACLLLSGYIGYLTSLVTARPRNKDDRQISFQPTFAASSRGARVAVALSARARFNAGARPASDSRNDL
jgi:RNA polymerase sigma-70 factor (ECF subfamily)